MDGGGMQHSWQAELDRACWGMAIPASG